MSKSEITVRPAAAADRLAVWAILQPILQAGETYTLPRDLDEAGALAYWFGPTHQVFVAVQGDQVLGTYYLRPNQAGGGDHVGNCGYMTAPAAAGRGVARAMCADSLARARAAGFTALQFNFVVATNQRAIRLWQSFGFEIVGRLPQAFRHPSAGLVDALVMYRLL